MKQDADNPSVIEKFHRQRQRVKRIMITLAFTIAVMVIVPLVLASFPVLRNHPLWKTFGNAWICLFGMVCTALGVSAWLNQGCPVCGKPVQELFWTARYCPNCGTKLADD